MKKLLFTQILEIMQLHLRWSQVIIQKLVQ